MVRVEFDGLSIEVNGEFKVVVDEGIFCFSLEIGGHWRRKSLEGACRKKKDRNQLEIAAKCPAVIISRHP